MKKSEKAHFVQVATLHLTCHGSASQCMQVRHHHNSPRELIQIIVPDLEISQGTISPFIDAHQVSTRFN